MLASTMLEIVLPRINQTYEVESKEYKITYAGETIKVSGDNIPVGIFIKISGSRFNDGYYEVIDKLSGGYHLDKVVTKGAGVAKITLLSIPHGLKDIVRQMANYAREQKEERIKSSSLPGMSITYFDEEDIFNKFSGMLGAYRRLKTI